jgi:hypothetical protein
MANKKEKVPIEWVNVIFFVFLAILVGIVFLVNGKMPSVMFLILIWIMLSVLTIILKATVLSGEREINNKEAGDIFLSSFISSLLIIGSTMMTVNYIPIIGRAFENTVGYWFINNEELANALSNVFTKPEGLDINLIATQLFYDSNDIDTKTTIYQEVKARNPSIKPWEVPFDIKFDCETHLGRTSKDLKKHCLIEDQFEELLEMVYYHRMGDPSHKNIYFYKPGVCHYHFYKDLIYNV